MFEIFATLSMRVGLIEMYSTSEWIKNPDFASLQLYSDKNMVDTPPQDRVEVAPRLANWGGCSPV